MEPAFEEGNILLFRKYGKPDRGDVVVVYVKAQDSVIIKRVLAVEGDNVIITKQGVWVNGERCLEGQLVSENMEIVIPKGEYFLLGDNWKESYDSRNFGCVDKTAILGILVMKLY